MNYKSLALTILISLIIPQVSFGLCIQSHDSIEYQMCKQNELQEKQIRLQEQAIRQQQQLQQLRNLEMELFNPKIQQAPFLY